MALLDTIKEKISGKKKPQAPVKAITQIALRDIKNLNRPAPTWRWNLVMPPLPGVTPEKVSPKKSFLSAISALISKSPQSLAVLCESIEIPPTISLGAQDRYYNGHMVKFPGLPNYETISAVFYESEDYATLNYFKEWQKYVYNPDTRVYGVPGDYGWTVEFIGLPVTDYADVKRYISIELFTCWPISVQKLSYGNTTDRIKIQVELAFHTMKTTIVGGPPSSKSNDLGSIVNNVTKWRS